MPDEADLAPALRAVVDKAGELGKVVLQQRVVGRVNRAVGATGRRPVRRREEGREALAGLSLSLSQPPGPGPSQRMPRSAPAGANALELEVVPVLGVEGLARQRAAQGAVHDGLDAEPAQHGAVHRVRCVSEEHVRQLGEEARQGGGETDKAQVRTAVRRAARCALLHVAREAGEGLQERGGREGVCALGASLRYASRAAGGGEREESARERQKEKEKGRKEGPDANLSFAASSVYMPSHAHTHRQTHTHTHTHAHTHTHTHCTSIYHRVACHMSELAVANSEPMMPSQ